MKKPLTILLISLSLAGCTRISKDCDYKLPEGWHLLRNPEGKYAVGLDANRILKWSYRYGNFDIGTPDDNESSLDRFDDSCRAKGFFKRHIEMDSVNIFK